MADLTPNQIRLLRELDFYGARAPTMPTEVLEKGGLVTAFALTKREVRYKITPAGRAVLPL